MNKKEYEKSLNEYPSALTVKEAAEILRVSTKLIYRLIKENKIPATKIGRENRISKSNLINYLRQSELQSTNPKCVVSDNTSEKNWTSDEVCDMYVIGKTIENSPGKRIFQMERKKGLITWQQPEPSSPTVCRKRKKGCTQ